ncbi:MAG TPA: YncE family protein [Streptosporangiaceae bacterium]|jgi:DNA-binding beta-propeller fold protein YncE
MFLLMAAMAALLPRVMNTFSGEDPVAGKPWYHEMITRLAARKAGWDAGSDVEETPEDEDGGSAASGLAWHCDYVDSYLYNPLWSAAGGVGRFKASLFAHDELVKVHFDDLTSVAQLNLMWRRYLGGTVAGLLWAADRDDVAAARHIVGVGLHALQDFYSHSNWVDALNRRDKTWFDVEAAVRNQMHLYTGNYEQEAQFGFKHHGKIAFDCAVLKEIVGEDIMNSLCDGFSPLSQTGLCRRWRECKSDSVPTHPDTVGGVDIPDNVVWLEPPGIALDSEWLSEVNVQNRDLPELGTEDPIELGKRIFDIARGLAVMHSAQWLQQLHTIMVGAGYADFWHRVRTERRTGAHVIPEAPGLADELAAYDDDLHQYEQPNKLPMTFLSAGAYPPHPSGSDEGWFVRLELHTSEASGAGTDSDIDAEIGGQKFRLDHGNDQNRLLEYNDFESGDHTWYLVGPFGERPTGITLYNNGTDLGDIIAAAWEDFKNAVSSILGSIGDFLLSLIGGHADYVSDDKVAWSWAELDALADTPGTEFELHVDGGDEGEYRVRGHLSVVRTLSGELQASVRLTELHCIEESDWDQGSNSDEPFILMLVNSPAADQVVPFRTSPFDDVDEGETRGIDMEPITVDVPRHGGLIVPIQIWESDEEGTDGRDRLLRGFASKYGDDTREPRSQFLDAVGQAIGPDWKLAAIDAYAFRRGPVVTTAHLARNRTIDRWIAADGSLTIPFGKTINRTVAVPALAPAITSTTLIDEGSVSGVAVGGGVVYAASCAPKIQGAPLPSGHVHALGSHLEPGVTAPAGKLTRSVAVNPATNRLYVVNDAESVTMLDATTLQPLATQPLGFGLADVDIDPGAGLVYVSQWLVTGGKVHVFRADDLTKVGVVTEASGFHGPQGIAVDAAAQRVYVARDFLSGGPDGPVVTALSVIRRLPDGQHIVERTVPLGEPAVQPIDVAVDVPAGLVYVAGLGSAQTPPRLLVLDRATCAVLGHVLIPGPARAVAAHPGTGVAYVVGEAGLTVVDAVDRTRQITLPIGAQPGAVTVEPESGVCYVGDLHDGTLTRIDPLDGLG